MNLKMKIILVLSFVCYVKSLKFEDCGGPDAIWHLKDVSWSPDPIVYPDPLDVKMEVEVSKDVPVDNLQLKVSIDKLTPSRMHIPCLNNFGSCAYDYCEYAKSNTQSKDLFEAFSKIQCPVKAQKQSLELPGRTIPRLGEIFEKVMEGGFEINATYINSKTGKVYGCGHAVFDVKLKH